MTKIEEILSAIDHNHPYLVIQEMIKEYAEFYAQRCLEIAAEKAEMKQRVPGNGYSLIVDKDSIINIKLPKHDD